MHPGWQHTHAQTDLPDEAWASALAAQGWTTWCGPGGWIVVNNTRRYSVALRRPCWWPWSVHDHTKACADLLDQQT